MMASMPFTYGALHVVWIVDGPSVQFQTGVVCFADKGTTQEPEADYGDSFGHLFVAPRLAVRRENARDSSRNKTAPIPRLRLTWRLPGFVVCTLSKFFQDAV